MRKITEIYLREQFNKYNNLYFNNTLPIPNFEVSKSTHRLGTYTFNRENKTHKITITDIYDITDKQIDNILLHEMIHLFQRVNNLSDKGHGFYFLLQCNRLNKYGWNLSRTTDTANWKIKEEYTNNKQYNIVIYKNNNGLYILVRYAPNAKKSFEDYFKSMNYKYKFFTSNNSMFEKFPNCTKRIRGFYTYRKEEYKQYEEYLK